MVDRYLIPQNKVAVITGNELADATVYWDKGAQQLIRYGELTANGQVRLGPYVENDTGTVAVTVENMNFKIRTF